MSDYVTDELAEEEFGFQLRRFGYYDSIEDAEWPFDWDEAGVAALVAEHRWTDCRPAEHYVPSRLWDASRPQRMMVVRL